MLNNQVVIVRGDRITDVGPGLPVPPNASVIDLSNATVLPGMIDMHVHVALRPGTQSVQYRMLVAASTALVDLNAGFTTVVDLDSRGGYGTVDLRNAINRGRRFR